MGRYKTISIGESTFTEFERMAESYSLTNKGLIEAMLMYFRATKADPRDPKIDNPTDAIKALDKRIYGFIKTQEKNLILPIKEAVFKIATEEPIHRENLEIVKLKILEMASPGGLATREDWRKVNNRLEEIMNALNIQ